VRATNEAVNARINLDYRRQRSVRDDRRPTGRWAVVAEAPNFLPLQGSADVSSSNFPVPGVDAAARSGTNARGARKTIGEDIAAAEALGKAASTTKQLPLINRFSRRTRG
jgi:hypothetical protein